MSKEDPNVGTALVGAPECGDVMKLQMKINPDTRLIEEGQFKTFGCGSAIASSSLATEWVKARRWMRRWRSRTRTSSVSFRCHGKDPLLRARRDAIKGPLAIGRKSTAWKCLFGEASH